MEWFEREMLDNTAEPVYLKRNWTCQQTTLKSIPVGGPFHTVGVDVLQLPLSYDGNRYVVIFIDYLTKWCEGFAIAYQTAETIAKLLVEKVICRHGVSEKLLSDRGANFMSDVIREICTLMGISIPSTD